MVENLRGILERFEEFKEYKLQAERAEGKYHRFTSQERTEETTEALRDIIDKVQSGNCPELEEYILTSVAPRVKLST